MAYIIFFLVAVAFGGHGYWLGAKRFGLVLLPLLIASILLWLLGPWFYRIDALRNAGLVWPGLILSLTGLIGGGVL